ncbi:NIPSNAP family protein [Aquibium sp. LZ166]|uniref:NIPSNAP family protein n=1 Tax=Aquibium pacificus TaxID=3153579 RepID=A0ABV3SM41_9HYPH
MIYDLRVYEHAEGKADAVRERFLAEVAPRFAGHGIDLVGVFVDTETGMLTYLTRHADDAARKRAWASFSADEGWKAAKAASEPDGPLISKQRITVLEPIGRGLLLG